MKWPAETCPGPEFTASETLGKSACSLCIQRCVDKLVRDTAIATVEKQQALVDSVTGLPNRQVFDKTFALMIRRKVPFGLMLCDLDGLKRVNDSIGHSQGDELLKLFSETAGGVKRPLDVLFRIGGDEFALLMDMESKKAVTPSAKEQLTKRYGSAFDFAVTDAGFSEELRLGVSIGYDVFAGGDGGHFFDIVDDLMMLDKQVRKAGYAFDLYDERDLPNIE